MSENTLNKFICRFFLSAVVLMVSACAGVGPPKPAPRWHCDAEADAAVEQGRWLEARKGHEDLLAVSPDNCLAIYHLGYIRGKLGDREKETAFYRQAVSCGYTQDDQLFFNLGMAYGELGRTDEALDAFKRAISINPRNADNHFGLGLVAQAAGLDSTAEQAMLKAIEFSPRHWDARLSLARLYLNQSRWNEAQRQIRAVLKADQRNEEAQELWEVLQSRKSLEY